MNKNTKGYLLALTTIFIWSSTFIITKLILEYVTPIQILFWRIFIAIIVLFIIYPKFNRMRNLHSELLFLLSGVALAFYFIFENTALDITYSSNVGLLVALSPLFTAIIVSIKEKKSYFIPKNIIGLILSFLGVGLIVFGLSGIKGVHPLGDLLALSAGLMFSLYTGFLSDVHKVYHVIQKTRKVFIYVLFTMLVYALIKGESIAWQNIAFSTLLGVFYLGIVASSFAFLFWNNAIDLIGTFKTNLFIYLIPLVTMIFSAIVFDDPITSIKILGAILILSGLYITERKSKKDVVSL